MNESDKKTHVLIFGATGQTGVELVKAAVDRGLRVTVFVRNADKAGKVLGRFSEQIEIIVGDALAAADVAKAFATQPDAVVTSLGIYQGKAGGDTLTQATAHILKAMQSTGVSRIINVSSLGVGDSHLQGNFITRLIQRTTLKHTLADKDQQERLLQNSDLKWTTLRPSRLMNGNGPAAFYTWQGAQPNAPLRWAVNRSDVATFALDCLNDAQSISKAYNITGCDATAA